MVTLLVDNKEIKDVTAKIGDWKIKNGAFDGNTAGSYTFVGTVKKSPTAMPTATAH